MKKNAYTVSIVDEYVVTIENNYSIFYFQLLELPHCCGVLEIGGIEFLEFECGNIWTANLKDEELHKAIIKAIKTVYKKENGKYKPCRKIIVNLINNSVCKVFEQCLLQTGCFKLIATFTNRNSHNEIRTYFSV